MAKHEEVSWTPDQAALALDRLAAQVPSAFDNVAKAQALVSRFTGLAIQDVEDEQQVAVVTDAHKQVRSVRLNVDRVHKDLKGPVNAYGGAIDAHRRELVAILKPTEDELKGELDKVKEHEAAKARAKLEQRLERLRAVNSVYAGKGDIVDAYSDEAFAELFAHEAAAFTKAEDDRRQREAQAAKEEQERRDADAKAKAERDALEAKAKELAEREAKIKAAEEAAEAKAKANAEAEAAAAAKKAADEARASEPVVAHEASPSIEREPEPTRPQVEAQEPEDFRAVGAAPPSSAMAEKVPTVDDAVQVLLAVARTVDDLNDGSALCELARHALKMYARATAGGAV